MSLMKAVLVYSWFSFETSSLVGSLTKSLRCQMLFHCSGIYSRHATRLCMLRPRLCFFKVLTDDLFAKQPTKCFEPLQKLRARLEPEKRFDPLVIYYWPFKVVVLLWFRSVRNISINVACCTPLLQPEDRWAVQIAHYNLIVSSKLALRAPYFYSCSPCCSVLVYFFNNSYSMNKRTTADIQGDVGAAKPG